MNAVFVVSEFLANLEGTNGDNVPLSKKVCR